jgi:Zn-dependent protease with chaperone function
MTRSFAARIPGTVAFLLCLAAPLAAQENKADGYAEYRFGDTLVVDGQRIVAGPKTKYKGATNLGTIPFGYAVKVEGRRQPNGAILASKVEARPNGEDERELELKKVTTQIEEEWVSKKMIYEPADSGRIMKVGDIVESGPQVERARRIMEQLRPDYVPPGALRVRVVKTKEWNASAMANGAIWVYSGLMDAMDDDELAIVLGHELAHYTHEHSRKNMSKGGLGQILGVGSQIAGVLIGGTGGALAQLGGQLGASALLSGYSREFEDQSDRVGLRYVEQGGFDVAKGPGLWMKFKEKYGEEDKLSNFFAGDHSRPTERIRNIEQQIRWNYPDAAAP